MTDSSKTRPSRVATFFSSPQQLRSILSYLEEGGPADHEVHHIFIASHTSRSNEMVEILLDGMGAEYIHRIEAMPKRHESGETNDVMLLEYEWSLREIVARLLATGSFDLAILGDARPFAFNYIVGDLAPTRVALVDDGSITPEIMRARYEGRHDVLRKRRRLRTSWGKRLGRDPSKWTALEVNTIYPCVGAHDDEIRLRMLPNADKEANFDQDANVIWIVGANHAESGITSKSEYFRILDYIRQYYGERRFLYFPHRRESEEKLRSIAFLFPFEVVVLPCGIEQHIRNERVLPAKMACIFSTVVDTTARMFPNRRLVDVFLPREAYYTSPKQRPHADFVLGTHCLNHLGNVNIIDQYNRGEKSVVRGFDGPKHKTLSFDSTFGCRSLRSVRTPAGRDRWGWLARIEVARVRRVSERIVEIESVSSLSFRFDLGESLLLERSNFEPVEATGIRRRGYVMTLEAATSEHGLSVGDTLQINCSHESPVHGENGMPIGTLLGQPRSRVAYPKLEELRMASSLDGLRVLPEGPHQILDPSGSTELTRFEEQTNKGMHRLRLRLDRLGETVQSVTFYVRLQGRTDFKVRHVFGKPGEIVEYRSPPLQEAEDEEERREIVETGSDNVVLTSYPGGWKQVTCRLQVGSRRASEVQFILLPSRTATSSFYRGAAYRRFAVAGFSVSCTRHPANTAVAADGNIRREPIGLGRGYGFVLNLGGLASGRRTLQVEVDGRVRVIRFEANSRSAADESTVAERVDLLLSYRGNDLTVVPLDKNPAWTVSIGDGENRRLGANTKVGSLTGPGSRVDPGPLQEFELCLPRAEWEETAPYLLQVDRFETAISFSDFWARMTGVVN